jgi:signal transduction histidine kinase/ActR/RegA family two-component response regulator
MPSSIGILSDISSDWIVGAGPEHIVHFYDKSHGLLEVVSSFIGSGLSRGAACVVVATAPLHALLEKRVEAGGARVADARRQERLVCADARKLLSSFVRNDLPDAALFSDGIGGLIARAACRGSMQPVFVFSEMVDVLFSEGRYDAGLRLEGLWNELARLHAFTLLCAYPIQRFATHADGAQFLRVCDAHSRMLSGDGCPMPHGVDPQLRTLARLEQKALELEVEQRRRTEQELQMRLRELTEMNRRKDEFLATLGHELRNPLAAVRTAVEAAQRSEQHRDRVLAIAMRQTQQLTRLVDDLLDVARIHHGRIKLEQRPTSLAEVVERAIDSTRSLIDARRHRLSVSLGERDVFVHADAARLEQVVVNLLSNAAKYTEPGGSIDVAVTLTCSEAILSVKDSGIGIAAEPLTEIFEPFTQVGRPLHREPGGLGIGLTVAREIVELHDGRIEAHSDGPGRGSEFIVCLPLLATPRPAERSGPSAEASRSRSRILVVEDNPDAAEALEVLLCSIGHEVVVTHDGRAAIEMAERVRPEVMLIDIGLPGMDGYEVARRVREHVDLAGVYLVALTGYGQAEDRERAVAAGFDRHVTKPIDVDTLQNLLQRPSAERARES